MPGLSDAKPLVQAAQETTKSYLFYGPPGTWKTTLAAKHPGKHKLWLDIDDKIKEMEHLTADERERIDVWTTGEALVPDEVTITNIDRTRKDVSMGSKILRKPMGYQKTADTLNELLKLAKKNEFPYDCVVLDSLTRLMNHLEYLILFQHNVTILNETLYGVAKRNIQDLLFGFLRLPCDRIVITHDRDRTKRDREGNVLERTIRPNVTGSMAEEIMGYFSEGYYFLGSNDQGKTWKIQTGGDSLKPARTTKALSYEHTINTNPASIFTVTHRA